MVGRKPKQTPFWPWKAHFITTGQPSLHFMSHSARNDWELEQFGTGATVVERVSPLCIPPKNDWEPNVVRAVANMWMRGRSVQACNPAPPPLSVFGTT